MSRVHVILGQAWRSSRPRLMRLIFTVSYLLWLAAHRRHPPVIGRAAEAGIVAQPSQ